MLSKLICGQCTNPIQVFPAIEDFESSNGGWTAGGNFSDWVWGAPSKPKINAAASGNNCWISGGLNTSFYNLNQRSFLQSPCYDLTNVALPLITFSIYWETENQYDGGNLQYSLDMGTTWQNIGTSNGIIDCYNSNWYNNASINNLNGLVNVKNGWCGNSLPTSGSCQGGNGSNGWVTAKQSVAALAHAPQVIFRFTFGAGSACNNYDGLAIDNFSVGDTPSPLIITTSTSPETCKGNDGAASINVSGGALPYTFLWNNGGTSSSIINVASATYAVTVTDALQCTSNTTAIVGKTPAVISTATTISDTCGKGLGSIQINVMQGSAPYTYQWLPNISSNSQAQMVVAGIYQIVVTDVNLCTTTLSASVSNAGSISVNLGVDTLICDTINQLLNPGIYDTYLWHDGSTLSTFTAQESGTYAVTVTDGSCSASSAIVIYSDCNEMLFIPNAFSPNDDGLNDVFIVNPGITSAYSLKVYNRLGALIYHTDAATTGWDGKNASKLLPCGLYAYVVTYTKFGSKPKSFSGTILMLP
jgi:gliding motility-associated-like protein